METERVVVVCPFCGGRELVAFGGREFYRLTRGATACPHCRALTVRVVAMPSAEQIRRTVTVRRAARRRAVGL